MSKLPLGSVKAFWVGQTLLSGMLIQHSCLAFVFARQECLAHQFTYLLTIRKIPKPISSTPTTAEANRL